MIRKVSIAFALIAIIVIGGFVLIFYVLPQIRVNSLIHVPPNTKLVYETEARWGSNVGIQSVYYLSSSDIDGLSNWYKDFYPAFKSGNPLQQWLITVKATDDKALNDKGLNADKLAILGHESLCNYHYGSYPCVTVTMVDLSVQKPLDVLITSSGRSSPEENKVLDSLPNTGILVIYRYFVYDS